jgi:hypothetical protein
MIYYRDIANCPMVAFRKALKGDYKAMKKGIFSTKKGCYKAFVAVFDEADKLFSLSENYRKYLHLRVIACNMYLKAVNGQTHYFTRAKIKEAEAESFLLGGDEAKFEHTCAMLSKKMGYPVRVNEVTVSEFYSYMELSE